MKKYYTSKANFFHFKASRAISITVRLISMIEMDARNKLAIFERALVPASPKTFDMGFEKKYLINPCNLINYELK